MNVVSYLQRVLADRSCFLCGEESELPICPACLAQFRRCDTQWTETELVAGRSSGFSAYWYEGTLRQAVLQMKVHGEFQLAKQLAARLASCMPPLPLTDHPIFIPIPGFGQTDNDVRHDFPRVASRVLAMALDGEDGAGLLKKIRRTPLQTQLSDPDRLTNVAGAFHLRSEAAQHLQGRTVVIVDDVLTTGATIGAATDVVLEARLHQCLYLTLARSRATIASGL